MKYLKFNTEQEAKDASHLAWLNLTGRTEEESKNYITQYLSGVVTDLDTGEAEIRIDEEHILYYTAEEQSAMTDEAQVVIEV